MKGKRPRTIAVHAGDAPDAATGSLDGIHLSSAFAFRDAEAAADAIAGRSDDYVYGRWGNPTVRALEKKLAALEGTEDAVAAASGMAALSALFFTLVKPGERIVAPTSMYAEARLYFSERLAGLGIEAAFVDMTDLAAVGDVVRRIRPRVVYTETPANPTLAVTDLGAVSALGREVGATVVCDSTFASPALQHPHDHGVDVVVHSMTKYLGGHGDALGGVFAASAELCKRVRTAWLRSLGGVLSPWAAWVVSRGMRTLPVRMEAHSESALLVAQFLEKHPAVARVHYPFLASHPGHEIARRQMSAGGGMLAFELKGGLAAGRAVQERVQIATLAVSLGDVRTLITHPASTTHASVGPDARRAAGIADGLVRYSVGLEDPEDLMEDLEQAL